MNGIVKKGTMEYKGYTAIFEWLEDENCYDGEVQDVTGTVGFTAYTLEEACKAFMEILDFHLEESAKDGLEPRLPKTKMPVTA